MSMLKTLTSQQKKNLEARAKRFLNNDGFCDQLAGSIAGCCATRYVNGFYVPTNEFTPNIDGEGVTARLRNAALVDAAVKIINQRIKEAEDLGKSVLVATINSEQLIADRALRKAGFTSTGWAKRNPRKSDYRTKVKVFIKNVYQEA